MAEGDLGGFGDARLRRVGAQLLAAMRAAPTMCLHALASDRNESIRFGRFLDNAAVSADAMLVHAGRLTGQRAAGRHVLAIQDTTELHFASHAGSKRGFGSAGNGDDIGLLIHPTVAVDAACGGVIGLVGAQVINRTAGKAAARRGRAAGDKESRRWLSGAEPADTPMLKAFNTRLEGRTALLKNPHGADTLAWFAWIVARLGGWAGYTSKGYTPPGPKTIARGLAKLDSMTEGWHLARSDHVRLP